MSRPFITTFSGNRFYFDDVESNNICLKDIAVGLARTPRWGGHTRQPFYVAQHSIIHSSLMPEDGQLEGLMHDASEAFMGDMSKPLKYLLPQSEYKAIENRLTKLIWKTFGLSDKYDPKDPNGDIKRIDTELLRGEAAFLMPPGTPEADQWESRTSPVRPAHFDVIYSHEEAYRMFILEYWKLKCRQLARRTTEARTVCICGSTRFCDMMAMLTWEEEKRGRMALGPHLLPWTHGVTGDHMAEKEGVASILDELHLKKIDLADEVLICNVDAYVGERTRHERDYAVKMGKPVFYLT